MPQVRHLTKLFKAIAANDFVTAEEVANQIALNEENKGHRIAAQLLRGSLRPNARVQSRAAESSNGQHGHPKLLSNALTTVTGAPRMDEVMLRSNSRSELAEIVREWKYGYQLAALRIRRRSKLFFY